MKKRFAVVVPLAGLMLVAGVVAANASVTIGSLVPAHPASNSGCGSCGWVQETTQIGKPSYAIPFNGVITSFKTQLGDTVNPGDTITPFVMHHVASQSYVTTGSIGVQSMPVASAGQILTFPARLKVVAGDLLGVGIDDSSGSTPGVYTAAGLDGTNVIGSFGGTPAMGVNTSTNTTSTGYALNLEAVVEPDVDGDGFGDDTQDLCPTDPTRQTNCLPFPDISAPLISQFKTLYKIFRFNPKGAVVSKRIHPGTTISLNLSEPAHVTFNVTKAFKGKITKGVCKKAGQSNRKGKRCTKTILVHTFARDLATGPNSFGYSGRYYDAKHNVGTLHPGPYRLTATAMDPSGNVGVPSTITFKVHH